MKRNIAVIAVGFVVACLAFPAVVARAHAAPLPATWQQSLSVVRPRTVQLGARFQF